MISGPKCGIVDSSCVRRINNSIESNQSGVGTSSHTPSLARLAHSTIIPRVNPKPSPSVILRNGASPASPSQSVSAIVAVGSGDSPTSKKQPAPSIKKQDRCKEPTASSAVAVDRNLRATPGRVAKQPVGAPGAKGTHAPKPDAAARIKNPAPNCTATTNTAVPAVTTRSFRKGKRPLTPPTTAPCRVSAMGGTNRSAGSTPKNSKGRLVGRKGIKKVCDRNKVNRARLCSHGRRLTRCPQCKQGSRDGTGSLCKHLKQKGWCTECGKLGLTYYGQERKRDSKADQNCACTTSHTLSQSKAAILY